MTSQTTGLREVIAANIDAAITAKEMTNREVGDAIGATEHQVWRWRRGKVKPSTRYMAALADTLVDGDLRRLLVAADDDRAAA